MSEATDVSSLTLASVAALRQPAIVSGPNGRTYAFVPVPGNTPNASAGYEVKDITPINAAEVLMPKIVAASVKMQTAGSLIEYTNRFKNATSMLFADIASDTALSILDYHSESTKIEDVKAAAIGGITPALAVHRATLHLPKSLEWLTWTQNSGKLMKHVDFATFLEENSIDIVSPIGGDLLELCRDLQAKGDYSFSSAVRMGDVTALEYSKKSDATNKGGMTMPTQVQLSIPVYFGESKVSITAFMRRKIDDGALFLGFQLSRAENVRQEEFHRVVDVLAEHTKLTTVYGAPA